MGYQSIQEFKDLFTGDQQQVKELLLSSSSENPFMLTETGKKP
jgi:hypothetical protein